MNSVKKEFEAKEISVANLPSEFTIKDPKSFILKMRKNFLRKAREAKKLSLDEVAKKCGITSKELNRIETGNINEQDMMILHELSKVYNLDYSNLLYMFKLIECSVPKEFGLAAFHDPNIDFETQKKLQKLIESLKVHEK